VDLGKVGYQYGMSRPHPLPEDNQTMADNTSNGPSPAATSGATSPTRKDMVRHAMKAVGADAKLVDLQKFIRDTYKAELSTNHISSNRGEIRREKSAKPAAKPAAKKPVAKKKPAAPVAARPAPAAARTGAANSGDFSLKDIETAKGLLGRLGTTRVKALLDVLAR
jgi:hypothetical protein